MESPTRDARVPEDGGGLYRFGPFVFDRARRLLLRGGEPVEVGPRALDTLAVLLDRAGTDVTREELMDAVWRDLHVTDANLTQSVSVLRKALGDSSRRPRFVATVPRRGYRFVAAVTRMDAADVSSGSSIGDSGNAAPRERVQARVAVVALMGVALGITLWAGLRPTRQSVAAAPSLTSPSLAILPFVPAGGRADPGEVLTLGTAERLIDRLERYPGVTVRPLRAVRSWRTGRDPAVVGRFLRVEAVLDGDVAREADRVVANVRLVETRSGAVVWQERVEVTADRSGELSDTILHSLGPALGLDAPGPSPSHVPTTDPEAHTAFLKGIYHLEGRMRFDEAGRWLERAVELDPGFAEAWAARGAVATFMDVDPERGETLALRALEIDPECGEAWAVLGFNRSIRQWRWREAGAALRRATELRPGLATAHHWLAYHFASQGRMEEALGSIRRAREIDPLSPILNADVGHLLHMAGRVGEAIEELERVIELDPEFGGAYLYLGDAYRAAGRYREAIVALEKARELEESEMARGMLAATYRLAGERQKAEETERGGLAPGIAVRVLLAENRIDEAADAVAKACRARHASVYLFRINPLFDPVRSHPRYPELLRCMGFGGNPEVAATG